MTIELISIELEGGGNAGELFFCSRIHYQFQTKWNSCVHYCGHGRLFLKHIFGANNIVSIGILLFWRGRGFRKSLSAYLSIKHCKIRWLSYYLLSFNYKSYHTEILYGRSSPISSMLIADFKPNIRTTIVTFLQNFRFSFNIKRFLRVIKSEQSSETCNFLPYMVSLTHFEKFVVFQSNK